MQKISTQLLPSNSDNRQLNVASPKKSTIEFLKQFARAYSYQRQMPYQLGHFIAN